MFDLKDYENLLIINLPKSRPAYMSAIRKVMNDDKLDFEELLDKIDFYIEDYTTGERKRLDYKNCNKQYALRKLKEFSSSEYVQKLSIKLSDIDNISIELFNSLLALKKSLLELGKINNEKFSIEPTCIKYGCVLIEVIMEFLNNSKELICFLASIITIIDFFKNLKEKNKLDKRIKELEEKIKEQDRIISDLKFLLENLKDKSTVINIGDKNQIVINAEIINQLISGENK